MTTWTDKTGRRLTVEPADGTNPARLVTEARGVTASFWLDDISLPEAAAALITAAGHPAPVILPRPDIDPAVSAELGPLGVWLAEGGDVVVAFGSRSTAVPLEPAAALTLAALIAAYAEASGTRKPAPAQELASRIEVLLSNGLSTGAIAAALVADGYGREARDGD